MIFYLLALVNQTTALQNIGRTLISMHRSPLINLDTSIGYLTAGLISSTQVWNHISLHMSGSVRCDVSLRNTFCLY